MKRHGNAKFTEEEEMHIRSLYATGVKQRDLARQFHVTQSCISKIVHEHDRYCVDCNTPIPTAKKRCAACRDTWQGQYFQQWYETNGRRGHVRRYRKRVTA